MSECSTFVIFAVLDARLCRRLSVLTAFYYYYFRYFSQSSILRFQLEIRQHDTADALQTRNAGDYNMNNAICG